MSPSWENVKVDNSNMRLYLSAPESNAQSARGDCHSRPDGRR